MEFLTALWLPILLSAVFVFVISSIIHTVLHFHKGDFGQLPGEETILETLRAQNVQPGHYYFPNAPSMKEMGSPEMLAKFEQGPVGFMTVIKNGPPKMGNSLVMWFLYTIIIGIFIAYCAYLGLGLGADYRAVFRLTGTIAVLAYGITYLPDSIWKGLSWRITFKHIVDGVIYGLVTAGTFGWLWPDA